MDDSSSTSTLKKSKSFWREWKNPTLEKNIIDVDLINHIFKKYCLDLSANNIIFPKEGNEILKEIYPYLKEKNFKHSLNSCQASLLKIQHPSPIHVDGNSWRLGVPGRQYIIPIYIQGSTEYSWGGTVFFKQNYIHSSSVGIEWQVMSNVKDVKNAIQNFRNFFGEGYSHLNEFYDSNGNILIKHNTLTCDYKDFGEFKLLKDNEIWLYGLDIEKYYNWYPGDLIGFNPFTIHSGANFHKDNIKCKYALRINTKNNF